MKRNLRSQLEALAARWEGWADAKARDAAVTTDDFGRRFITNGEICYRNCARDLRELLATLPPPGPWLDPEKALAADKEMIAALYRARDDEMLANIRASGQPVSIFNTDDYPREGCTVVIRVGVEDDIRMDIYRPGVEPGTPGALPMERWAPAPANAVAVRLYDWLCGRRPRHNARSYSFE